MVYAWIFAAGVWVRTGTVDVRTAVATALVTAWGVRLTFNYARKGGYKPGEEDYRWAVVRRFVPHPLAWAVFNLVFIAVYQNILLMLLTAPVWAASVDAASGAAAPWAATDTIGTIAFVVFLAGETVADNQQWAFQTAKHAMLKAGRRLGELPAPHRVGFATGGLFSMSRHPNFLCEIMMWYSMYLLSVAPLASAAAKGAGVAAAAVWPLPGWAAAAGVPRAAANATAAGAVLLHMLFLGSTVLTERITAGKYPLYAAYQRRVPMLVPWMPAEGVTAADEAALGKRTQ
nr:hypothetical protein HK105_003828 [Polyrhizophydium stewartii]